MTRPSCCAIFATCTNSLVRAGYKPLTIRADISVRIGVVARTDGEVQTRRSPRPLIVKKCVHQGDDNCLRIAHAPAQPLLNPNRSWSPACEYDRPFCGPLSRRH